MQIKATLKPGHKGTKKLSDKYGERLLCVRYRYDQQCGKRYTTVELIEEEVEWLTEDPVRTVAPAPADNRRLGIKVDYWENDLRGRVKAAGAIWRPRQKLWEMRYEDVLALGLEDRVVTDDALEVHGASVSRSRYLDVDI